MVSTRIEGRGSQGRGITRWALVVLVGLLGPVSCKTLSPPPQQTQQQDPDAWDGKLETFGLYDEVDDGEGSSQLVEVVEKNPNAYVLLGTLLLPQGADLGGVYVEGGRILDLWNGTQVPAEYTSSTIIQTQGVILPGLIDLGNHVAYNFLPAWKPGKIFRSRYEWQKHTSYRRNVSGPYLAARNLKLLDELVKFGEVRSLAGGVSSIVGCPPTPGAGMLVRNLDHATLGGDTLRVHMGSIEELGCDRGKPGCPGQEEVLAKLRAELDAGNLKALLVHVAEGSPDDPLTRSELGRLQALGLVRPGVTIAHGTALTAAELESLGKARMGLVWSPRSDITLYGRTVDIAAAKKAGVRIALSPDWTPTGSDNLLGELRYAARFNRDRLKGLFTSRELVEMATSTPAALVGRGDQIGTIRIGLVADLLVLDTLDANPYDSVLKSDEQHVLLVTVNGVPVYGRPEWLDRLGKAGDHEQILVRGRTKAIDATVEDKSLPKGQQTFAQLRTALEQAYASFGTLPSFIANDP